MNSISSCLLLLNIESTQESVCIKDELNDSIDLRIDTKINEMERQIVKYLQSMGIQTKTDPKQKELQYWNLRRIESNKKLEEHWNCQKLSLNSSVNRLLLRRKSPVIKCFNNSGTHLQAFLTS
ncbi:unnamed protein product [Paramecium sonneborni]|uniref:Uncharacterized protein n=1 Tax=Paramecium sonneborni TaxID=65129 RepID=A0A8S1R2S2_9CILI|nr:unnamed protein product [Paramecium sonneborni]